MDRSPHVPGREPEEHKPAGAQPDRSPPPPSDAPAIRPTAEDEDPRCRCGERLSHRDQFCSQCGTPTGSAEERFSLSILGDDGSVVQTIPLVTDDVTIGSDPDNSVILSDDRYASRRHARLTKVDGDFSLEDLGSSNGTYLRLQRALVLRAGDELRVGTTVLRLEKHCR